MKRDQLVALLFLVTALVDIVIGYLFSDSLPIPQDRAKVLGEGLFVLGMALFAWSLVFLKRAFFGDIVPTTNNLVQRGPYRWVRHPLYLSMMITLLGIAMVFRSWLGILGVFIFFLPVAVYRARLEEAYLTQKYGQAWRSYAQRTRFLIPFVW